jgi:hypothetical protein
MKKMILAILAVIAVFSICFAGIVSAAKEGYGFTIGGAESVDPTFNGAVAAGEWDTDSYQDWLYNGWTKSTSFFRDKWGTAPAICECWCIEVLTDTTNDAGDYIKFSVDCGSGFSTPPVGGAAPSATAWQLTVTGHPGTVTMQQGTGTAWGAWAAPVSGTDYNVATSIAASPSSATAHWIIEIYLDKGTAGGVLAMGYNNNARLEAYDASTGQTLMWPPLSSANVPDTYGAGTTGAVVPEGLTIGVMVALSTIAVIVGTRYFKKPKI